MELKNGQYLTNIASKTNSMKHFKPQICISIIKLPAVIYDYNYAEVFISSKIYKPETEYLLI